MSRTDRLLARIAHAGLWLLGSLPLPWLHRLGGLVGAIGARGHGRESRVARVNMRLCFHDLDGASRERLRRACMRHTACVLLECGRIWTRPAQSSLGWIREVRGIEHLDAARAGGRGVIVAAPHLGNWELFGRYLSTLGPFSLVYRPPQWAPAEHLLLQGRGGGSVEQLPAQPGSVRGMLRALKTGRLLGLLPDQQPKVGEGSFAPFFGIEALTMTLLSRLAARAAAPVVFGFAERLPAGAGFRIHFLPAPAGVDCADESIALGALNAGVEACVRLCPEQYQWTYKRFSRRPPGENNPYLRGHSADADESESA